MIVSDSYIDNMIIYSNFGIIWLNKWDKQSKIGIVDCIINVTNHRVQQND